MGSCTNQAILSLFVVVTGVLSSFVQAQVTPSDRPVRVETGPYGIMFVSIPAGTFQMGSDDGEPDEKPVHTVRITKPFQIGQFELTQQQWRKVMGTDPSYFKGDKRPVEQVSWNDVQEFVARLNELNDGWRYRLPTEAEWEYAARAGSTTNYPWGDNMDGEYAWYARNSDGQTHDVGTKQPNAWGLYDVIGNAWEWCQDWKSSSYYASSPVNDPQGPLTGSSRVRRGGGFRVLGISVRTANRGDRNPKDRPDFLGFRLVRSKD